MVHVVAFSNAVQRCAHNKAEIQKNKANAHKSLRAGMHSVGNQFIEHDRTPVLLEVMAGTGNFQSGKNAFPRKEWRSACFFMPV